MEGQDDVSHAPHGDVVSMSLRIPACRPLPRLCRPRVSRLNGRIAAAERFRGSLMVESDVVEIDGVFVGAAILQANRTDRAFFATHDRLRPMHGAVLPSMAALRHQATRHFRGVSSTAETIAGSRRID